MSIADIGIIVAIVGTVTNFLVLVLTKGKQDGIILTELGYIKAKVDESMSDQKADRKELTAVVESSKQAHKRIDRLEKA